MQVNEEKNRIIFERGVEDIIERDHLKAALQSGKKLRVKLGIDPTAPDLHLGHAVPLRKLRQFQVAGHQIMLIIGDFTAQIGDPSGQALARKSLSGQEVKNNLQKYLLLAGKIIDTKKTKIYYNSHWYKKDGVKKVLTLLSIGSIQQALRREDFQKRLKDGEDVTLLEACYALLQGYDSVETKTDIEIGGSDQRLNILTGRRIQRHFGLPEQDVMMLSLLEGTDGERKMSKSYGNYISLDAKPNDIYGKIMSVPDYLINKYFELLTDVPMNEISKMEKNLSPLERKKKIAHAIVFAFHSKHSADAAQKNFDETFSEKKIPENIETKIAYKGQPWFEFLFMEKLIESKSQARQLIKSGGLDFNEKKVKNYYDKIVDVGVARIGKHRFIKIEIEDKKKKV